VLQFLLASLSSLVDWTFWRLLFGNIERTVSENLGNPSGLGKILRGERPSLSIEITRECPLRCPGCYAYGDAHLGGGLTLRTLNDRKGQELVAGVLEVVIASSPCIFRS
jgi:hypothetical protein